MKKFYYSLAGILLINILPGQTIAVTNDKGLDLSSYGMWAGYGFLIIIAISFLYFLYYSSPENEKRLQVIIQKSVAKNASAFIPASGVFTLLKMVNYSIISLLLLYFTIFVLLIT